MNRVILFFLLITSISVNAAVNPKNGNFYIAYADIIVSERGHNLEITRTYNSQSKHNGWFGYGWGSEFETFLTVSADGSIVIHENGAGSQTRYLSVDEQNVLGEKRYFNEERRQTLIATESGYRRIISHGHEEYFSKYGLLRRIKYKYGYIVTLVYNPNASIDEIIDTQGLKLKFNWSQDKKLKTITANTGVFAQYKFQGRDLIQSIDSKGNIYNYAYNSRFGLTTITYMDKSQHSIRYQNNTGFVEQVIHRDSQIDEYLYGLYKGGSQENYWTSVITKTESGRSSKRLYLYENKISTDNSLYTHRLTTSRHGVVTETTYNESALPVKISRGRFVTHFKYEKGRLIEKRNSKGKFYYISYYLDSNKVSEVIYHDGWKRFFYNDNFELIKITTSQGKYLNLSYDDVGHINKMSGVVVQGETEQTLVFSYNEQGRQDGVNLIGVGKIQITYDKNAEIEDILCDGGFSLKLDIVTSLQAFLAFTKLKGVDLSI